MFRGDLRYLRRFGAWFNRRVDGVDDLAFAVYRVAKGVVVAALNGVYAILMGRVERGLEAGGLVRLQQAREGIGWIIADDQPLLFRPRSWGLRFFILAP